MNRIALSLLAAVIMCPQAARAYETVDLSDVSIYSRVPWSEVVTLEDQFHGTTTLAVLDQDYHQVEIGIFMGNLSIWTQDTVSVRKEIEGVGTAAAEVKVEVGEQLFELSQTEMPGTFGMTAELRDAIANYEDQITLYLVYEDGSLGEYSIGSGTVRAYGELLDTLSD